MTLLLGWPGATFWSVAIAMALVAYMVTIGRLVRSHRMPIDFAARHAIAGIIWLVLAIVCGLTLAIIGPQGIAGNRIASAYGAMGLLGWVSNFIIGMSYQLFPGFVVHARNAAGWRAVTIAELSIKPPRWMVFVAYNAGVAHHGRGIYAIVGRAGADWERSQSRSEDSSTARRLYGHLSFAYRKAVPAARRTFRCEFFPARRGCVRR